MTGNRRALALRCRAKGHIVATVDIDPDGVAWLTVPRPSVAEKRGDVIGHDRRGRYGPGVTNLDQLQAGNESRGMFAACACGVDYFVPMPDLWLRAQAEQRTVLPLDPHHWRPPARRERGGVEH